MVGTVGVVVEQVGRRKMNIFCIEGLSCFCQTLREKRLFETLFLEEVTF